MYLEIDEGFDEHPKTIRLCRVMKDVNAGQYLFRIWAWACRSAKDGDVSGMEAEDIEIVAKYAARDGKLFSALVEVWSTKFGPWIDRDGEKMKLHGWDERTGLAIQKMEKAADDKKLYRLHRDGKCDRLSCKFCNKQQRLSSDSPKTQPGRGEDKTAQDKTRQDKTSQDKTRPERDSGARDPGAGGTESEPVAAALPRGTTVPPNDPGKPSPRTVLTRFGSIRAELCGGKALFWQPSQTAVDKAAAWLADMHDDGVADIDPAIRLACEHVKSCTEGWSDSKMSDPNFLFGTFVARWSGLREELHNCSPKIARGRSARPWRPAAPVKLGTASGKYAEESARDPDVGELIGRLADAKEAP